VLIIESIRGESIRDRINKEVNEVLMIMLLDLDVEGVEEHG